MNIAERNNPSPLLLCREEQWMQAGFTKADMRCHHAVGLHGFLQTTFPPEQGGIGRKEHVSHVE